MTGAQVGQTNGDPGAVPRLRRLVPRSLASRLIVGTVLLSAVLVAVPGGLAYSRLRADLTGRLDAQLAAAEGGPLYRVVHGGAEHAPSPQVLWVTQLDAAGNVLDSLPATGEVRHMWLSAPDRSRLAMPRASPITIRTTDGRTLRVVSEPQPELEGMFVIGLSTDSVDGPLHHLLALELLLAAGAAGVAGLAAWGIRLNLRPLRRLTTTARLVATDVTDQGAGLGRRAPLDFAQANNEVGELTQAFNTLLDAIETEFAARTASERRMRQFLADASHELRTPLTSIRGYAELEGMRQRRDGAITNDALTRIEAESGRMARLVEDLLTLARGDQGQPATSAPVDLSALTREAAELTVAGHPDRHIRATIEAELATVGDEAQLLRAVRNVLTNAAIHTRAPGSIRIDARPHREGTLISVSDSGPGMTPEHAQHAFERFWRADESRVRATGGTGLGLAIVKSIIAAHHGTLELHSTVAHGTIINLWLPTAPPERTTPAVA